MFDHIFPTRVVNLRYTVNGLHFDAAIDCDWQLHAYGEDPETKKKRVPIELYCFDHTEWDIRVFFQELNNDQIKGKGPAMLHTEVELEEIIKETKKWIEEMEEEPIKPENNEENIMPLF
jgi:hypothetical protein